MVPPPMQIPGATVGQRLHFMWPELLRAATAHGIDPFVLAALAWRESNALDVPGDGGHAWSPFQIHDRYHSAFVRSWLAAGRPLGLAADYAAGLIASALGRARAVARDDRDALRIALAAYNASEARVLQLYRAGRDVDEATTARNYSADVLRRAEELRTRGLA